MYTLVTLPWLASRQWSRVTPARFIIHLRVTVAVIDVDIKKRAEGRLISFNNPWSTSSGRGLQSRQQNFSIRRSWMINNELHDFMSSEYLTNVHRTLRAITVHWKRPPVILRMSPRQILVWTLFAIREAAASFLSSL